MKLFQIVFCAIAPFMHEHLGA